jgi:hypothetical protein
MQIIDQRYNLGFTAAALLYRDSVLLAKLYIKTRDWQKVREQVLADNLLQIRTISAQKRIYSETYTRLKLLDETSLLIIADGEQEDQMQIIWYAICKKYAFIRDFCVEVISEKIKLNSDLTEADYHIFFNRKSITHEELVSISTSSAKKLMKNLFRMLLRMGILNEEGKLIPLRVSKEVKYIVEKDPEIPMMIFPGEN